MAVKTVITQLKEQKEKAGIHVLFPQNQTLYVDQFTGYSPDTAEEHALFSPTTIDDVFEYYKPSIDGILLTTEDGEYRSEDFHFASVSDFDDDQLIALSETLTDGICKKETYHTIIRHLERNRDLRHVMSDPEARDAFVNALKSIRKELSDHKVG